MQKQKNKENKVVDGNNNYNTGQITVP